MVQWWRQGSSKQCFGWAICNCSADSQLSKVSVYDWSCIANELSQFQRSSSRVFMHSSYDKFYHSRFMHNGACPSKLDSHHFRRLGGWECSRCILCSAHILCQYSIHLTVVSHFGWSSGQPYRNPTKPLKTTAPLTLGTVESSSSDKAQIGK